MTDRDDPTREIARQFADALDRDDYGTAADFLTPETTYTIHGRLFIGPDEILARYRDSSEWAHSAFDRIDYESSVELLDDDRVRVTFIDRITHAGETLEHEARQILRIDPEDEAIEGIKHVDLPEESEKIEEFFRKTGVDRPPPR